MTRRRRRSLSRSFLHSHSSWSNMHSCASSFSALVRRYGVTGGSRIGYFTWFILMVLCGSCERSGSFDGLPQYSFTKADIASALYDVWRSLNTEGAEGITKLMIFVQ